MNYYVIYRCPKDYPDELVMRKYTINGDGSIKPHDNPYVSDSLEVLRRSVPSGLVCVPASKNDDPVIVETWLWDTRL